MLPSPYRSLIDPLLEYIEQVRAEHRQGYVTVILPEFVPKRMWHHLLHNQHALLIKGALLFKPNVVVTSVPFHLGRAVSALILLLLFPALCMAQAAPATPVSEEPKPVPFSFADFSWLSGNPRTTESPLQIKGFTGEFRADVNYNYSFNDPVDNTIVGSTEVLRSGEFTLTQLGVGGDFDWDNVQGRVMTQFRPVRHGYTAQRREPGTRAMATGPCVPLSLRSIRRLPFRRTQRDQPPGWDFHVLLGPLELLQLR